jgi:POT family proton-dependent oligopeptide transporter
MAPVFTWAWQYLGKRGRDPSTPLKFSLGLAQIGLGFLVLYAGILIEGDALTIGLIWVALMYFLHTTGELMLSPVGLSAVTKLSVKRMVGFMMGIWFMAIALAQVAASLVSKATTVPEGTAPAAALAQFGSVYLWLGIASIGAAAIMAVASPALAKMQHGRD